MKKTYRQHLLECTEPWAADALQYLEEDGQMADMETEYLSEAIGGGFLWSATKPGQGVAYWRSIYWKIRTTEQND